MMSLTYLERVPKKMSETLQFKHQSNVYSVSILSTELISTGSKTLRVPLTIILEVSQRPIESCPQKATAADSAVMIIHIIQKKHLLESELKFHKPNLCPKLKRYQAMARSKMRENTSIKRWWKRLQVNLTLLSHLKPKGIKKQESVPTQQPSGLLSKTKG